MNPNISAERRGWPVKLRRRTTGRIARGHIANATAVAGTSAVFGRQPRSMPPLGVATVFPSRRHTAMLLSLEEREEWGGRCPCHQGGYGAGDVGRAGGISSSVDARYDATTEPRPAVAMLCAVDRGRRESSGGIACEPSIYQAIAHCTSHLASHYLFVPSESVRKLPRGYFCPENFRNLH